MNTPHTYTIEQKGSEAGLKDWWTVSRNGNALRHFPTKANAEAWLRDCKAAEVAAGERPPSPAQEAAGWGKG